MTLLKRHSPYLLDVRRVVGSGADIFAALGVTKRVGKFNLDGTLSVTAELSGTVYDVAFDGSTVYAIVGVEGNVEKALQVYDTDLTLQSSTELRYYGDYGWVVVADGYVVVPSEDSVVFLTSDNLEEVAEVCANPKATDVIHTADSTFELLYADNTSTVVSISKKRMDNGWQYDAASGKHYRLDGESLPFKTSSAVATATKSERASITSADSDTFVLSNVLEAGTIDTSYNIPPAANYAPNTNLTTVSEWANFGEQPLRSYYFQPVIPRGWGGVVSPSSSRQAVAIIQNTGITRVRITGAMTIRVPGNPPADNAPSQLAIAIDFLNKAGGVVSSASVATISSALCVSAWPTYGTTPNTFYDAYAYYGPWQQYAFIRNFAGDGYFPVLWYPVPPDTAIVRPRISLTCPGGISGDGSVPGDFGVELDYAGKASAWLGFEGGAWTDGTTVDYTNFEGGEAETGLAAKYQSDGLWYNDDSAVQHASLLQIAKPQRNALYIETAGFHYRPRKTNGTKAPSDMTLLYDSVLYTVRGSKVYGDEVLYEVLSAPPAGLIGTNEGLEYGKGIETTHLSLRIKSRGKYELEVFT